MPYIRATWIAVSELADLAPDGERELILDGGHHPCCMSDTSANKCLSSHSLKEAKL